MYRLFQRLVYREAGIYLSEVKRELFVARLTRRLRILGLNSFGVYYRRVKADPAERVHMLDCLCTNETHFFREPRQFKLLEQELLPALEQAAAARRRQRSIRVWSAGCSSGQEPYSIAMTLLSCLPGWQVAVLGTDLSTKALAQAQAGLWSIDKMAEIPRHYLKRFMLRGVRDQDGKMRAGRELRAVVRFVRLNLNDPCFEVAGPFDLIFCRNVLIYFDAESRASALRRILSQLSPRGYLFLGHSENLSNGAFGLHGVIPTVYATPSESHCRSRPWRESQAVHLT